MHTGLRNTGLLVIGALGAALLVAGCATVPAGNPATGYAIHGFVGKTAQTAAPGATVLLLDGATGQPLASTEANFLGKYSFAGLQPGHYWINVQDRSREVVLTAENQRLDLNLSAEDGALDYTAAGAQELAQALSGAQPGPAGTAAAPGPNDPELAKKLAGVWWGYSGSTETKIALCEGGRFRDFSESGFSGSSTDGGGNQTMNWGSASQGGGEGAWSIQGTADSGTISVRYDSGRTRTIQYRSCGDNGCLLFDGRKLCRSEGC